MQLLPTKKHIQVLISIANQSIEPSYDYAPPLKELEKYYLDIAKKMIPVLYQSRVLSTIRFEFIQLENLCKGIQLLNEFPEKAKNKIESFPEKLSHYLREEKDALQLKQVLS